MTGSSVLGFTTSPANGGLLGMLANGLIDPSILLQYIRALGDSGKGTINDAAHANILGQFLSDRSGSNFGGGQPGITARDVEMMGRGRAPMTAGGIMTALGNASGLLRGVTSPLGLAGLAMTATGNRPTGIVGNLVNSIFGGQVRDIPGYSAYDKDLVAAVGGGGMTRAQADVIQAQRNANIARTSGGGSIRGGYGDHGGNSSGGAPGGGFGHGAAGTSASGGDY